MTIKYPVACPLLKNNEIDEYTCFEIHTVVDGTSPENIAPIEILKHSNYKDICRNCKYHRKD